MAKQEIGSSGLGQQAAAAISMLLPVLQFFYQWLPSNLSGIFLGQDIFFFVSVITLILSLLVIFWYRATPYFRWLPPWKAKDQKEYSQFLRDTDPRLHTPEEIKKVKTVVPPPEVTAPFVAALAIPVVFILGIAFVWIGLANQVNPPVWLQAIQSSLYVLTIVLCAFSATHYYLALEGQKEWKWTNQTKIQRAIQLAIENNGFPEMPRIDYLASGEPQPMTFPPVFYVVVNVKGRRYSIKTDQRAEILMSVDDVTPPTTTPKV